MEQRNRSGAAKGAEPATFPVPIALLHRVRVHDGSQTYHVESVDGDFVRVAGAEWLLPVRRLVGETAFISVGQRVDRYLRKKVDTPRHGEVVAAATIAAALVGYPRDGKSGRRAAGPLDRVWTDHLALVNGDPPEDAWEISSDKAPISDHIRRKHGRIKYWVDEDPVPAP
jgi:hypothetical protein